MLVYLQQCLHARGNIATEICHTPIRSLIGRADAFEVYRLETSNAYNAQRKTPRMVALRQPGWLMGQTSSGQLTVNARQPAGRSAAIAVSKPRQSPCAGLQQPAVIRVTELLVALIPS